MFIKKMIVMIIMARYGTLFATHPLIDRLKQAYPDHIAEINDLTVTWHDGTRMALYNDHDNKTDDEKLNHPSLAEQMSAIYLSGIPQPIPLDDPGRVRYEPFFRKMYGNSKEEVASHLTTIDWMPTIFGDGTYRLQVTTINQVDKKLKQISQELEQLVSENPHYLIFLVRPGGTFNWRCIAHTTRLSNHSFGMTIDINVAQSHYWQWDLARDGNEIKEDALLTYHNKIPHEIVQIFEKYGFIWGGKWYHYDTMHFEYRPELFLCS